VSTAGLIRAPVYYTKLSKYFALPDNNLFILLAHIYCTAEIITVALVLINEVALYAGSGCYLYLYADM